MTNLDAVLDELRRDLVEIPAGSTLIGSTPEIISAELSAPDLAGVRPEWLLKEVPRHTVWLPTFWISRVPLTGRQVAILGEATGVGPVQSAGPDHPASLSVDDWFALCRALTDLLGQPVAPPTEQQWVRAARGDDDRIYPWGNDWQEGRANMGQSSLGRTCPVGSYPQGRSAFGLLDMAGNADELTRTRYAPFPGAPPEVPLVEDWAYAPYITKGGGYMHARDLARCDRRHGIYAEGEPLALRLVVEQSP